MKFLNPSPTPTGFLISDLIVWGGLRGGGWVTKGFELRVPDFSHAAPETLNSVQDAQRILLRGLNRHERIQFHLRCDGNYEREFSIYAEETKRVAHPWVRRVREQRLERYVAQWRQGTLRRLRFFVFRARRVDFPIRGWSRSRIQNELSSALEQLVTEFAEWGRGVSELFRPFGIELCPLSDADHYRLFAHTFNPSLEFRSGFDPLTWFDPKRPLIEGCWFSEAVGHQDTGFCLDGMEQAVLVMSRPPQMTKPGLLNPLVQQTFRDFTVTLAIEPLEVETVIKKAEESFRRVEADLARDRRVGDEAVLEKKRLQAKALREGFLRPFHFRFVVHVWAPSRAELNTRLLALKQGFQAMAGAQWFEPNLPTTCRKLWEQAWPGWVGSEYPHFKLYAEDSWLADLI